MAVHPAALPQAPDVFLCFLWCYFCCSTSLALLMFCTARRFQQHSALAVRHKGTGSRDRCLAARERGLTQIFICSTLTSAQQGSVSLVWITLFMRISLLVINAWALYKGGFKFLFETRLQKCCQMIFLPRQTVPFLWKMGMLCWLQKTLIWYKLSSYLQTQPLCSSKR